MPKVPNLSSWLVATLAGQALGLPMEAVRRGRQATVMTILGQLLLQGIKWCFQPHHFFSPCCVLFWELFPILDVLLQGLNGRDCLQERITQGLILLSKLFQFLILRHVVTVANFWQCWQAPDSPPE